MQDNDSVILVDAVSSGRTPGSVVRLNADEIRAENSQMSTHDIGLAEVLQLGRSLQRLPPQLLVLGLETGADINRQCTPAERDQLGHAVRMALSRAKDAHSGSKTGSDN
jgi:hydrogenase maturation protease